MNKSGIVFDIIRNSLVDGRGISTTVFFKGCNLRCKWCHNPESWVSEKQLLFYKNKCTNCGICKEVCPFNLQNCDLCGKCEIYCPNNARKICGKEMTSDEVIQEIIKDKAFYNASQGGVTFSGGECMLQIDFLCELLKKCKENGIQTAIDTAGNVPWQSFEKIMPYTDIFLYDIKCASEELHKKWVGASNKLILENLKKLSDNFPGDLYIRIPLISGVNDSEIELQKIKDLLHSAKHTKVDILPYHGMGEYKYDAMNMKIMKFSSPDDIILNKFKEELQR